MADNKTIAIKVELKGTEAQKKKLAALETEVKKLTNQRTKLNKQLKDGTINTKQYGAAIAKVNTGLKAHRRELLVTRQEMLGIDGFTTRLGKSFRKMGSSIVAGFAGLFAIQKVGQLFSEVVNIFKEFEQANANLASVLGTTVDKISSLTEDAKRLGAATAFSATEVSKLQTEFAKLGFTESQILDATEATLSLAAATGSDLAQAAAIAGATLGGFGLDARDTQKVVDVMAKSFSTSALDIEKFRESMKFAAPAAKAVGVSVEETTALLGTLANAGISGSLAGTGLAKTFTMLNKEGLTLQEGLEQVSNSQNKLKTATELVGQTAAKSFLVLAEGTETTKALKTGLENAGGAAKRMADTQLDTLEGKTKILNSAWEGLVLSLTAGDSAFNRIAKGIVEATTSILNFLTTSESAAEVSRDNVKANRDLANSSKSLLSEYESLTENGVKPTKEEKERLDVITLRLKRALGDSVVAIDKETGAFKLNTEEVKRQIKLKRLQVDQEASTAAGRFLNSKDRIENIQAEIKAQQLALQTAERVRRREIDAENERIKGQNIRFKNSEEFIQATSDQVAAQKALRELNEKLEVAEGKRSENLKILTEAGYNAAEAEDLLGERTRRT
jgi:TP901 family phage tail tape measure protein